MDDPAIEKRIAGLSDVDLVRLLTVDAGKSTPEVLAIAEAEANRRGVPIDEAFIPAGQDDAGSTDDALKEDDLQQFEAGGKSISCAHCGNEEFHPREILLNTRGLTFLKLDWLNRSATALVCGKCGRIELFAVPPTPLENG